MENFSIMIHQHQKLNMKMKTPKSTRMFTLGNALVVVFLVVDIISLIALAVTKIAPPEHIPITI